MSHLSSPKNRPLLLNADNTTPPTRTPWGGDRIAAHYKDGLVSPGLIGESWEISVEPDFPSRVIEAGEEIALDDLIAAEPVGMLGSNTVARFGGLPLLVKLLDAAAPLSVQIHPRDDDPALGEGESGKPESWYVLEADEGAGFWIGMREGVDEAALRAAIEGEQDASALLEFIPVVPGDFFVLGPGTPHAIGPGVTLVETQRVLPGRRGLTYRYWDWNRRYDAEGQIDPHGAPRELHLERALAVTDWTARSAWRRMGVPDLGGAPVYEVAGMPGGELDSPDLRVHRVVGSGDVSVDAWDVLRGLTVVAGEVLVFAAGAPPLPVRRGQSVVLPASTGEVRLTLDHAHALITWIP